MIFVKTIIALRQTNITSYFRQSNMLDVLMNELYYIYEYERNCLTGTI